MHRILSAASVTKPLPGPPDTGLGVRGTAASPDDWIQADAVANSPQGHQLLDAAASLSQDAVGCTISAPDGSPLDADDTAGLRPSNDGLGLPPPPEPRAAPSGGGNMFNHPDSVALPAGNGLPPSAAMGAADDSNDQLTVSPAQPASAEADTEHKHVDEDQSHEQEHIEGGQAEADQKQLSFDIRNCRALGSGLPHSLAGASPPGQEAAIRRVLGPDAASGAAVSIACTHDTVHLSDGACACGLLCTLPHLLALAGMLLRACD